MNTINKDLRTAAFFLKYFSFSSKRGFKIAHWLCTKVAGSKLKGLENREVWIPRSGEDSNIRARIYLPLKMSGNDGRKLPVLLYLHGGGYLMGVPEIGHSRISLLIKERNCVVVAPDYRKSPDHPYPAALDDCYDTLLWIKGNAEALGIRDDQMIVGGHSAGGGLTAALSLYVREKGTVNIAFQMPIYPMIDDRQTHGSAVNNTMPLWNSKTNKLGWDLYLRALHEKGEGVPVYAAPSRAQDYSGLPPTITFVGDIEPFKDETIEYVENLQKAGVPVQFELFEGCFHGFETVVPNAAVSKAADRFLSTAFAYGVDHYFAEQA